jgi:hypothetical protein
MGWFHDDDVKAVRIQDHGTAVAEAFPNDDFVNEVESNRLVYY